jgi:hypothetical protein
MSSPFPVSTARAIRAARVALSLGALAFAGCEYEFPLTAQPTRATDEKLIGDWISVDGLDTMKVRRLDDTTYAIAYNGDLYTAQHTEFAGTAFVSALHLDPQNRKYSFLAWNLSDGDTRLRLRVVSSKIIPKETRDRAALQARLREHLANPALYGVTKSYTRVR